MNTAAKVRGSGPASLTTTTRTTINSTTTMETIEMAATLDQRKHIDSLITMGVEYIEHAIRQATDLGEWALVERLVDVRRSAAEIRRPKPTPHPSECDCLKCRGLGGLGVPGG